MLILAWVWAPILLVAVGVGLGLLLDVATRGRVPDGLVAPIGLCVGILLMGPLYHLGLTVPVTTVCTVLIALAGLILGRARLVAMRPGAPALAALATYVLFMAPTALAGHWGWAGYNFTNDPSNTLTATWWILHHAYDLPAARDSVTTIVATGGVEQGYPLGAHLLIGTLRPLVGVDLAAIYQPGIAVMGAMCAAAFAALARYVGLSRVWAAAAAVVAVGANLFYVYGQLGGLKEITTAMALATATAVGMRSHPADWSFGTVAVVVVALGALVPVLSAGGIAYAGMFAVVVAIIALAARRGRSLATLRQAAFGLVLFALVTSFSLPAAFRFGSTVNSELSSAGVLGQLLRPLPLGQIGGIWWAADWRVQIAPGLSWDVNRLLLALVFVLAVVGVVAALRRRRGLALVGLATAVGLLVVLGPRTSPYGESKLFVLLSPFVVFAAGLGGWWLTTHLPRRPLRWAAGALTAVLAAGVLLSDAITYHAVRLAPTARLTALQDVADAARGKGLVLHNEFEEWMKYFYRDAQVASGGEVWLGPRPWELRHNIPVLGDVYDLDEMKLRYVTSFPAIVTRTSPAASRPPANFKLAYRNRYYELWQRTDDETVVRHLPIQGLYTSEVEAPCRDLRRFARQARSGDTLVAAHTPPNVTMQPSEVVHSTTFVEQPGVPGVVIPTGPGWARGRTHIDAGTYDVWLYGSSGRPVSAIVDGRVVGRLHEVNTLEQWVRVGTVTLRDGTHRLEIRRPGGSLAPGDGYAGIIGPLALQPAAARESTLTRVAPSEVDELCDAGPLDWVEIVRPEG